LFGFILQEVSEAAEEGKSILCVEDLGANFYQLKQEYGQSAEDQSLYTLFQSFKETAVCQ